jgi:hypothetical protein
MPSTYEPIATSSSTTGVTFSSIASTYTDLKVVVYQPNAGSNVNGATLRLNGDTGNNYSSIAYIGNGSTTAAYSYNNADRIYGYVSSTSSAQIIWFDIMSYSNTTTNKVVLNYVADGYIQQNVGVWRSTAAVNSVTLLFGGTTASGTITTLYGIKAA